jgi:hypothetical protein
VTGEHFDLVFSLTPKNEPFEGHGKRIINIANAAMGAFSWCYLLVCVAMTLKNELNLPVVVVGLTESHQNNSY